MRITLGMISRQYTKSLNESLNSLNYYANRSITNRKFNKASEDPFSAAQAYKLRRETQQNSDYTSNYEDVNSMLLTGESSIRSIYSVAQNTSSGDILGGITGTMQTEDKNNVATKLRKMQEYIVSTMNTKYADQFIFGGSGTGSAPFTVDGGQLLYRGVNVETGINTNGASTKIGSTTINFGKANAGNLNDYKIEISKVSGSTGDKGVNSVSLDAGTKTIKVELKDGGAANKDLQDKLQSLGTTFISGTDFSKVTVSGNEDDMVSLSAVPGGSPVASAISNKVDLNQLAKEPMYVDIGLGLNFKTDGTLNTQSVFDASMPGIAYLGYGTNNAGISNNLYTLMGNIADKLSDPNFSIDSVQPYIDQFNKSESNLLRYHGIRI